MIVLGGAGGVVAAASAGFGRAESMLSAAATDLAQGVGSPGGPDLVGDFVTLSTASVQASASVLVERSAEKTSQALLDMLV